MTKPRPEPTWRGWAVKLAIGWVAGLATVAVGGLIFTQTGLFDATAFDPHDPTIAWATHQTMIRSVQLRAHAITPPPGFTAAQVQAGFHAYDTECVMCHGGPGVAREAWVTGLNPTPPFVIDSARRWNAAQLYWIVGEGVKMTAMPAWRTTQTSSDVWNLVAFLEALPNLSPADYARMRAADQAAKDAVG
jgi:mono/diheme cytochrome c family protein